MIGKVTPEDLRASVLSRTGRDDDSVLTGPRYGEDAAAIDLDGTTLVVSSDPISLATGRIGTLGVYVASNDVAASGADPRWMTVVMFLPDEADIEPITRQLDETAREVGVAIVGGHSEYAPDRSRPLLSLTCFGPAERFVPTGGARPGDRVILTKGAGIEGTAILATDFRDVIDAPDEVFERAATFFDDVSVVPDARAVRDRATAMHDPTEGGLIDGLLELARASGVALDVDRSAIPVREVTALLCETAGVDPLKIFGSGSLIATVPPDAVEDTLERLAAAGIDAAEIGTVADGDPALHLGGETILEPVRDDLYPLWE